jgi:potassium voltage-gated channel Eag-related subfamily H protein 7
LIIEQLSENLREKLMIEANSIILNGCLLFKECFSENLQKKLVKKFLQVCIQPENIINFQKLNPGISADNGIYLAFIE